MRDAYRDALSAQLAQAESIHADSRGHKKGHKPTSFGRIPWEFLFAMAGHYHSGAEKYNEDFDTQETNPNGDNWRKGGRYSEGYEALTRHLWLWWAGEDSSHLVAAAWHCATLWWYDLRGVGVDDRPVPPDQEETRT